jgi:putative zinc finger protein
VTCLDARDRFSEYVDERLTRDERAAIDAHLFECAACRQELERFRATIALVRAVEPARAPAGFVDHVLASARPRAIRDADRRPWWQRVAERAFSPLPAKLPLEAAAIVLVGVGVTYLLTHDSELREAARLAPPPVMERQAPTPPPTPPAAPSHAEQLAPPRREPPSTPVAKSAEPAAREDRAKQRAKEVERAAPSSAAAPPSAAPPPVAQSENATATRTVRPRAAAPSTMEARDTLRLASKASVVHVVGALDVDARERAIAAIRDIVLRRHGEVFDTREETNATTIMLHVPRDEYAAFVSDLTTIGRWREERASAELPADVFVTIRIRD